MFFGIELIDRLWRLSQMGYAFGRKIYLIGTLFRSLFEFLNNYFLE